MRHIRGFLVLTGATLLLAGAWVRAEPTPSTDTITPNPAIQNEIARAAAATSENQLQASVAKLREMGGPDFRQLIPQLVYYLVSAKDVREAMTPGVICNRLQISPAQLRQALAPYQSTSDARLKKQIDNLLSAPPESPTPAGGSAQ